MSVYRGNIENEADILVTFPSDEETEEIYDRLESILENFQSIPAGDSPFEVDEIERDCRYVLDIFRRTTLIEWCLYDLVMNHQISLLPGEGITLTIPSYCLDADAAAPDEEEFFIPKRITGDEAVWLLPLLEHAGKYADEGSPIQELIWNMGRGESFRDLPEDQQELLKKVVPDAASRYFSNKLGERLRERFMDRLRENFPIIDDFEEASQRINERKMETGPVKPDYDAFRLPNGLLLRIRSTGNFTETELTIVNPREADLSVKQNLPHIDLPMFAGFGAPIPVDDDSVPLSFDVVDWWSRNKDNIRSRSERAGDVVDALEAYNDEGLQGVEDYAAGRGFEEAVDFYKGLNSGNPEAEKAFDTFKNFNKDLYNARNERNRRPGKSGFRKLRPAEWKFESNRKGPQPIAPKGGY